MSRDDSERVKLASGLSRLGLEPGSEIIERLLAYMALLKEWSRTYNLIAPGDRDFLLARHLLDSLSIAHSLKPGRLLDIGTGAGLPAVPLAIVDPGLDVTAVDGTGKKIRFIRHVCRTLGQKNVHPLHLRIEDLVVEEPFENIISRAFASLRQFVELARPLADENTQLLAMKGAYPTGEIEALPDWVEVVLVEPLTVPYLHAERHLVLMSLKNKESKK